jgi:hypothetical protein
MRQYGGIEEALNLKNFFFWEWKGGVWGSDSVVCYLEIYK